MQKMIEAVKRHAVENYETDGWDFVVECWSDEDILDRIEGAESAEEAIRLVGEDIEVLS
jgi:hypothetical protein